MTDETNGRATIREVYDLINKQEKDLLLPMMSRQVKIEIKLDNFLETYEKGHKELQDDVITVCEANKEEHELFKKWIFSKISIKSFIAWTACVTTLIGLGLFLLKFFGVLI